MNNTKCSSGSLRNVQLRGTSLVKVEKVIYFDFYLFFIKLKTDNVEGTKFKLLKV